MNDLQRYFEANTRNRIFKWTHFFEIYDRHFARYRGTDVHMVEIGVYQGGSLQMWKEYFGPRARLFGVDVEPLCKGLEEEQIRILIGDQEDRAFLGRLKQEVPRVDILLDDGGHTMAQQIATFEELYAHVAPDGLYVCEDLNTSYAEVYGGGYRARGSFIEYSKHFIDRLHAWHSEEPGKLEVSDFTRSTFGLHYYNGILVIEKRPVGKPEAHMTGQLVIPTQPPPPAPPPLWRRGLRKARRFLRS